MPPKGGTRGKGGVFDPATLKPNDHVFVSAPWSHREGEPYLIARIISLLPPLPSSSPSTSAPAPRARVNYYLRPRDISNRYIADFRLIVATMHADIVPLAYVRGKCEVKHKEEIPDLENWKREKDCFYWHQLYDRYLHRYFDAVPVDKIQNAPVDVVRHLVSHFEYILCEVGMGIELSDAQRGCTMCHKWASSPESVTCARCKHIFHLSCLDPPLLQKPKVGYSWSCAPCSKAHDEEVESYMESGIAPTKKVEGKDKGKGKEKEKEVGKKGKGKGRELGRSRAGMRTTNGWPFRYFGMHTEAYAVLDPHDSLYPRAKTRLGNKFQAVVPTWDEQRGEQSEATETGRVYFTKRPKAGTSKEKAAEKAAKLQPQRGEDEACKIIWQPSDDQPDSDLDELLVDVKKLPHYHEAGVDLINRAFSLLKDGDTRAALAGAKKTKLKDLGHATWTLDEKAKLADGASHHGNDIEQIVEGIKTKKNADVVKRYYIHVGHSMQEDIPQQIEEKVAAASRIERTGKSKASTSDDEGSVAGAPVSAAAKRARGCAVCGTKTAKEWFRCPESLGQTSRASSDIHVMCDECGFRWRHYGMQYPLSGEELKPLPVKPARKEKIEEPKEVIVKPVRAVTPPPPPPPPPKPILPPKPCLLCKRIEPKVTLAQCIQCTLSVHASCYGIYDGTPLEDWLCDLCELDEKRTPLNAHPQCVLCPPLQEIDDSAPITALECLKPTEQHNYVHLLCATWHPEVKFSDPQALRIAEGIPLIPVKRVTQECFICKVAGVGACVQCEDCTRYFHVSCAWTAGFKFAFEIKPLKKKSAAVAVRFKDEDGAMSACIWCSDHHFSQIDRVTYDLGQRDSKSKLTALQAYVRNNKSAFTSADTFPLLRQARRLDTLIESVLTPPPPPPRAPSPILEEPDVIMAPPPPVAAKAKKPKAPPKAPKVAKVAKPKPAPASKVAKPKKQSGPKKVVRHLPPPRALAAPTPPQPAVPQFSSLAALLNHDGPKEGEGSNTPSPYTFPSSPQQLPTEPSQPAWDPNLDPLLQETLLALQSLQSTSPDPFPPIRAPIDYSSAFAALAAPPILPNGVDVARTNGGRFASVAAFPPTPTTTLPFDSRSGGASSYSASPVTGAASPAVDSPNGTADPFAQYCRAQESTLAAARTREFGDASGGSRDRTASPAQSTSSLASSSTGPPVYAVLGGPSTDLAPVCHNCGTTKSPMFRRDDDGRHICNACGLYFKSRGVHRPNDVKRKGSESRTVKRKAVEEATPDAGPRCHKRKPKPASERPRPPSLAPLLGAPSPLRAPPLTAYQAPPASPPSTSYTHSIPPTSFGSTYSNGSPAYDPYALPPSLDSSQLPFLFAPTTIPDAFPALPSLPPMATGTSNGQGRSELSNFFDLLDPALR